MMDDEALIALLQATYDSSQALATQYEAAERRAEEEIAVLRRERDLLLRRVAALEAAHSELQRTRGQLGDALRRAARAELEAEAARGRPLFRLAKALRALWRALARRGAAGSHPATATGLVRRRGNGVVLVDVVGWPAGDLEEVLDRLAARRDADGTVMILLTDSDRFDLFRARGFVFEYLAAHGTAHAERVTELSVAYRVDTVLTARDDADLVGGGHGTSDRAVA